MHRDHLLALLGRDDQLLGVDRLPEHLFGNTGGRIDVDRHIHRTGEFRREAVDSLDLLEHHAEIDHVHPVVKPFDAELHHVEHRHLLAWHGIFAQRRGKDRSLYLQRIGGSRVVKHLDAMAAYEGLDAVYALHGLHLGRKSLRRTEALDRLQALHLERLQFSTFS